MIFKIVKIEEVKNCSSNWVSLEGSFHGDKSRLEISAFDLPRNNRERPYVGQRFILNLELEPEIPIDFNENLVSLDSAFATSAAGLAGGLKMVGSVASESGIELKKDTM